MKQELRVLVNLGERSYIRRIYSLGHDSNLGAWQEEVEESFGAICQQFDDDASHCRLQGEARWMWLKITKANRAYSKPNEFKGAQPVTMIRVHRAPSKARQR